MLNTTHFAVGLAIGRNISIPGTAFFAGLISHFVLDWIPHWDGIEAGADGKVKWNSRKNLAAIFRDLAVTAALAFYAVRVGWLGWDAAHASAIWGVLGAVFPDLLWIPHYVLGMRRPRFFFDFHRHIQHSAGFLPGIAPQIALVAVSLWFAH